MINEIINKARNYNEIKLWANVKPEQWIDYKWQIQNSIKSVEQLKDVINLNDFQLNEINRTINLLKSEGKEPLRITPYYASLMKENPLDCFQLKSEKKRKRIDPIFWQSVPTPANIIFPNTGIEGAMNEEKRTYGAAYQRYPNRAALFVAQNTNCSSYCVHCQRAKSLDCKSDINIENIKKGIFYINYNKNIDEVLVTGGDALMISNDRLKFVLEELSKIKHLRTIRIATRVPVVLPMLIREELLELIKTSANKYSVGIEKNVYFMTHINHYNEITEELFYAAKLIREYGFTIRNQTVLLNHVNDNLQILLETFRRMFWIGIHPYYLLQCHKEMGIVHFITPIQEGKIFIKHLQGWLSGVCMPKYAANVEGGGGKILLMPSGHDTLGSNDDIDKAISKSYAKVTTWDGKIIDKYEALGRATKSEFISGVKLMDRFIGDKNVFLPKLIIIDDEGNHIKTTNRTYLPYLDNNDKSMLFNYEKYSEGLPLTNPYEITSLLDELYNKNVKSDEEV